METPMHSISMIAAISASDRGLGKDGDLLFKIPEDMRYFQTKTTGHPVIMGRKTWESIPASNRPLSGRTNIVISRQPGYAVQGGIVVKSLDEAIESAKLAPGSEEVFVIGGAEIYAAALPLASRLYLTLVSKEKPADVFFPEYQRWFTRVVSKKPFVSEKGTDCEIVTLDRDPNVPL